MIAHQNERSDNMWFLWPVFGVAAIIAAVLNLAFCFSGKEAKYFRFASLSLTALTMCAMYSMVNNWVLYEDWSALMDVVPAMTRALWFLVIASILINGLSLFVRKGDKK